MDLAVSTQAKPLIFSPFPESISRSAANDRVCELLIIVSQTVHHHLMRHGLAECGGHKVFGSGERFLNV